jgi:hypothetical protein
MMPSQPVTDVTKFAVAPPIELLLEQKVDLERNFVRLESQNSVSLGQSAGMSAKAKGEQRALPEDVLERSTELLELLLSLAAMSEAILVVNMRSLDELPAASARIQAIATSIAGLDPAKCLMNASWFWQGASQSMRNAPVDPDLEHFKAALPRFVRFLKSAVDACPIRELETIAAHTARARHGHRCRTAYERLQAFLRRNAPDADGNTKLIGRAYAEGRVTIDEATALLAMPKSDAVALLERLGFARSISSIRLGDEERAKLLERMAEDRKARQARPWVDPAHIQRDVLSTQRIESVDARPWILTGQD